MSEMRTVTTWFEVDWKRLPSPPKDFEDWSRERIDEWAENGTQVLLIIHLLEEYLATATMDHCMNLAFVLESLRIPEEVS